VTLGQELRQGLDLAKMRLSLLGLSAPDWRRLIRAVHERTADGVMVEAHRSAVAYIALDSNRTPLLRAICDLRSWQVRIADTDVRDEIVVS
jgi:hypothetical protein